MPTAHDAGIEFDLGDDSPMERPIVRLCTKMLSDALLNRAQTLRMLPLDAEWGSVEYERDGTWQLAMQIPNGAFGQLIDRIKAMAGLNLEQRGAQEGDVRVRHGDEHRTLVVRTEPGASFDSVTINGFMARTA